MATIITSMLAVIFSAALSLWMMIAGWGLTPVSWPVIIAGYCLLLFPTALQAALYRK